MLANEACFDQDTRHQVYSDIYDDAMWLINLVENLLSVTRINKGEMKLNLTAELMDEIIDEALRHIHRKKVEHSITVKSGGDFIMAKVDARLMVQVIINLVDNAIKYTQPGSHIEIRTEKKNKTVIITVSDDGPGIPDGMKPKSFDLFYTGTGEIADSRRGLGLGLALCRSVIQAHGGDITVEDNQPKGTVFRFTLQAEEVILHE